MIDELYSVTIGGKNYDIIDLEADDFIVIDGNKVYQQWLDECEKPCLCESRFLCSCGSEDHPNGECPHIKALFQYFKEQTD